MKYKDLIATIKFLEKANDTKFESIDLVHEDFNFIVDELKCEVILNHANETYIKINIFERFIDIYNVDENPILKIGSATFSSNLDIAAMKRKNNQNHVYFLTQKVLSEEECLIKELLE